MDPPFLVLSNNNDAPSDAEAFWLRTARRDAQAAIDYIDGEIATLKARRHNHEISLQRCDEALAAVRKVPDDVLSSIFLSSCNEEDDELNLMASSHPAVVASHVCKDWRRASLSTTKLWSRISITTPDHPLMLPAQEYPHLVDDAEIRWNARMKQLFELSWTLPRAPGPKIHGLGGEAPRDVISKFKGLIDLACGVAWRWESVDITMFMNNFADIERILSLKAEDVPLLRTVRLRTYVRIEPTYPPVNPPPGGFLMSKALRDLVVIRLPPGSWRNLSVNWANLRTLQLGVEGGRGDVGSPKSSQIYETLGPLDALSLLSSCPNLVRCELSVKDVDGFDLGGMQDWGATVDPPRDFGQTVTLPHLEALTFQQSEPITDFIRCIEAPALRELEFLGSFIPYADPLTMQLRLSQRFMAAIDRFGMQLTDIRFTLLYLVHDTAAVTQCFHNLPNLVYLHLENTAPRPGAVGDNSFHHLEKTSKFLLDLLTPPFNRGGGSSVSVVCPKLKHFACTLLTRGFTETQLVNFIANRRKKSEGKCVSQIIEVRVAFGVLPQIGVRSKLQEIGVGLEDFVLKVTYPRPSSLRTLRAY